MRRTFEGFDGDFDFDLGDFLARGDDGFLMRIEEKMIKNFMIGVFYESDGARPLAHVLVRKS